MWHPAALLAFFGRAWKASASVLHEDAHAHLLPGRGLRVHLQDAHLERRGVPVDAHHREHGVLVRWNVTELGPMVARRNGLGVMRVAGSGTSSSSVPTLSSPSPSAPSQNWNPATLNDISWRDGSCMLAPSLST